MPLVISAVESVDDFVLEKFDKGHTRADSSPSPHDFENWA